MDKNISSYKKKWQKPELIILIRDKAAESILDFCKGGGGNGPTGGWQCRSTRMVDVPCIIPPEPPPPGTAYVCPHPAQQRPVEYGCAGIGYS